MSKADNDLIRGHADLLVLSVLAEQPLYGYAISKQVISKSDGQIRLTAGVLYPLLHRMEKKGWLNSSWDEGSGDDGPDEKPGRRRKWYRISAKGKRRLESGLALHRQFLAVVESFLPDASNVSD